MSGNEADELAKKVETIRGTAEAPNQLALQLLKDASDINALVVITRDMDGRLDVLWTDQDLADVAEASMTLAAQVQHDCFTEHLDPEAGEECDD